MNPEAKYQLIGHRQILMASISRILLILNAVLWNLTWICPSVGNNNLVHTFLSLEETTDLKPMPEPVPEINPQTNSFRKTFILPPKFPDKAPYGWFGSAILCPWLVGPKAPFYWNRACAGPVPPFRKPKDTTDDKLVYPVARPDAPATTLSPETSHDYYYPNDYYATDPDYESKAQVEEDTDWFPLEIEWLEDEDDSNKPEYYYKGNTKGITSKRKRRGRLMPIDEYIYDE